MTEYLKEAENVITFDDLSRHIYVLGGTGTGKTTLTRIIAKGLEQANETGEFKSSFIYIDLKGDDSFKFLAQCKALNPDKVFFLDPVLTSFSVNPLELPSYSNDEERERLVSVYTGFLMKVLEEWYGASTEKTPRMLRIMRSLISYLYHKHDAPTLIDLYDVVIRIQRGDDIVLMEDIERTLPEQSELLKQELQSIQEMRGEAFDPVLTRLSEFATDPFLRKMFSVRRSTLDFRKLLEPGSFSIIRVAGHEVGSHIAPLIAAVCVLKIWFSVQERAQKIRNEKERTLVLLCLDEFQDISSLQAIETILAQARSFGLGLLLSHQTTAQLTEQRLRIILSNCAVQACGRVSGDDAQRIAANWDPQYKKEIIQTLTTQADFRWSFRFRADPGKEASPPLLNVKLAQPPQEIHSWDEIQQFIEEEKNRYGFGVIEQPLLRAEEAKAGEWMSYSTILPIPKREEWFILTTLFLSDKPLGIGEVAERTAIDRDDVSAKLVQMNEKGLVKIARSDRLGRKEYSIGKEGLALLPSLKKEDYRWIGGEEAQDLAVKFVKYAIERKWFVSLAIQGQRERKPDLVAFDYEKNESIAVEIESTDHILHSHPEQVKQHMLEIEPFDKMIIVIKRGEAEEKAKTLLNQITDEEKKQRIEIIFF